MHCSRVDAFRHRADPIFPERTMEGHLMSGLTLICRARDRLNRRYICLRSRCDHGDEKADRATKVMRQGLCPTLNCAREALNPLAASLAII
jgi:hypothetical protein